MRTVQVRRVRRFGATERLAHWLLASSFLVLLASGLALYLPSLANVVARPFAKAVHLDAAIALGAGLVLLALAGDRRALRRTLHDLDRFDADDTRWLVGGPRRLLTGEAAPPQGRFNAGQKLNAALVGGGMVVMAVTGVLLWYGERDTRFRLAGTVYIHDWLTFILLALVAGHVYLAVLNPATRQALRGMTLGDVEREWALAHHRKWVEAQDGDAAASGGSASPQAVSPERR